MTYPKNMNFLTTYPLLESIGLLPSFLFLSPLFILHNLFFYFIFSIFYFLLTFFLSYLLCFALLLNVNMSCTCHPFSSFFPFLFLFFLFLLFFSFLFLQPQFPFHIVNIINPRITKVR